jgi:pimeloyl-ACP methyl ester carboxylesterase
MPLRFLPILLVGLFATFPDAAAVVSRGSGPAVVILSGLLGGTVRFEPLADSLVHEGFRVVIVDPYRLGVQAADVSFDGLAREVDRALAREDARDAIIIAHSHATGIALRLAANAPDRVRRLILLDGGITPSTRTPGIALSMRLASIISHIPGGKSFIRSRIHAGLRANSGHTGWITDSTARQYADPVVAELPRVTRMAQRLAEAREPEAPEAVLARVRAPVFLLLGDAPHETAPDSAELTPLLARTTTQSRRLAGVGHFVHEEAIDQVLRAVRLAELHRDR